MSIVRDDTTKAVGDLRLFGGQDAGYEAAVNLMHGIFGTNKTEAVLFVDAENTFNSINRQIFFCIKSNKSVHLFLCAAVTMFQQNYLYPVIKSYHLQKAPHREVRCDGNFWKSVNATPETFSDLLS